MSDSEKKLEQKQTETFGSFFISNNEFALAISSLQEVVNAPRSYTAVPLAPSFMKGLYNLRGTVVPVLDLQDLLHLPPPAKGSDSQKIAIIELEGSYVGLLFDRTGELFRSNDEEMSHFVSHSSSVVSGVFKKDSGQRIIQILNVENIFQLQNVPKDKSRNRLGRNGLGQKRGNRMQCISFIVGPAKCALPISQIQEILKVNRISESALSGEHCIGTIDLRGTTVPVVDFTALLEYREVDNSDMATQGDRRIVVMKLENELFGLLVDSIDSIVSFFQDELLTFPIVEQKKANMFLGCITGHGNLDILLLDHQNILSNEEVIEITRGHSKLYQQQSKMQERRSKGGNRKTYITFSINGSYAVAINEVKEIIDYPSQLLQPPGLKKHIRGILNLRGDLVTIIDARSLYATTGSCDAKIIQKVLVFNRNGIHIGLVVDSVESIISFAEHDKINLPKAFLGSGDLSADISEAVEVTDTQGEKRSLLILNVDSVTSRASKSVA